MFHTDHGNHTVVCPVHARRCRPPSGTCWFGCTQRNWHSSTHKQFRDSSFRAVEGHHFRVTTSRCSLPRGFHRCGARHAHSGSSSLGVLFWVAAQSALMRWHPGWSWNKKVGHGALACQRQRKRGRNRTPDPWRVNRSRVSSRMCRLLLLRRLALMLLWDPG